MRKALARASLVLAFAPLAGCMGPQEEGPGPEYPASQPEQTEAVSADAAQLGGLWMGQACQSDGPCFTMQIALAWNDEGKPIGNIAYPSVPCKARLEFVRWESGGVAAFRERFTNAGKCVPDGWIRLKMLDSDSLAFEWAYPNGRVDVGTTLDRAR